MTKHTAGPWTCSVSKEVEREDEFSVVLAFDGNGNALEICTLEGKSPYSVSEGQANAYLIAAAPELLDALNSFPMLLSPATTAWGKQVQEWQDKALPAVAKAEGK